MNANDKLIQIKSETRRANRDNISRTIKYEQFYFRHPEIKWSLLAGIVSRNAGWNMTDLESKWFQHSFKKSDRDLLFQTFERANWTIFEDAYPQLLWYESEKQATTPRFHLLVDLAVSQFMQREWKRFWLERDKERLCTALIINEQNIIEQTMLKQPPYKRKVFGTLAYFLEEHAHLSYVLFPTKGGNIYGLYIRKFMDVHKRIWLGKQLQQLLFHPQIFADVYEFSLKTIPTGSRQDYQQYMNWSTGNTSPPLRSVFPVVEHTWTTKLDWSLQKKNTRLQFATLRKTKPVERTKWLQRKWFEVYLLLKMKNIFSTHQERKGKGW